MNIKNTDWLVQKGALPQVINELMTTVGALPGAYLELLKIGNGGEVELRCSPYNLCLDSAESALSYWRSGTYTKSGVFVFGGNGGGELLAFDMNNEGVWPVVCFDPISPDDSTQIVATDFEQLLAQVVAQHG